MQPIFEKALDETSYDLNAAAYTTTLSIARPYTFLAIYMNFSDAESKTITLSITDGTSTVILKKWTNDTSTDIVWSPTPSPAVPLPKGLNIKLDITQTSGACTANWLMIVVK